MRHVTFTAPAADAGAVSFRKAWATTGADAMRHCIDLSDGFADIMGDLGWHCLGSPSRWSPITTETTNSTAFKAQDRVWKDLLLKAFAEASGVNNKIWLELSFKDRELIGQIADSVVFWAPHIDTGANDLKV